MRYFTTMEDMSEENFPHTAVPAHDESLQQPATHSQVASQITDNIVDAEVAPQSQGTPALDIRSLVKIFDQRAVVDGINLTVPRGSFYGLVGRNGAGKTTSLYGYRYAQTYPGPGAHWRGRYLGAAAGR